MKNLIKDKAFKLGFLIPVFAILGGNLFATKLVILKGGWGTPVGFPFRFYFMWTDGTTGIIWRYLIADILIAVAFSFLVGLVFRFVWSKLNIKELQ